jgi:3-methyladenine DNA glycosylase AlkD
MLHTLVKNYILITFRVKKFAVWILRNIGAENNKLCWDRAFGEKMKSVFKKKRRH